MKLRWLVVLALLLSLAACGGGAPATAPTAAPATPQATAAPTAVSTPGATAAPTAAPLPATGTLVVYHKSGGIMGINDTLTVAADGTLTLTSRKGGPSTTKVDQAALHRLVELLGSAEFAALPPRAEVPGADQFVYEISVAGRAQPTVLTMDGVQNPAVLDAVIAELEHLRGLVR